MSGPVLLFAKRAHAFTDQKKRLRREPSRLLKPNSYERHNAKDHLAQENPKASSLSGSGRHVDVSA